MWNMEHTSHKRGPAMIHAFWVILFAITIIIGSTGCFLFKKKCDCPSFGKKSTQTQPAV